MAFSDTHFHFSMMCGRTGTDGSEIISRMAERNCFFALDIGTEHDDLPRRRETVENALSHVAPELRAQSRAMMHYSAGLWPSPEAIINRASYIASLEGCIARFPEKVVAIGEGGIDHHWNPSGEDGRSERDFDSDMYNGERELFEMQLALAKRLQLPMIVHSRDGFQDTLDCIKNAQYDNGIIHCYSYGLEEAKKFLERGWHISFSGAVTYTKRTKFEAMKALVQYVPDDRILCETDAPYLAPVPHRGEVNTPVYVEHVYDYVASLRGVSVEALCERVDGNCKKLFGV
ncbi:MAG: TatD family hydrolase [Treponema sp.]|nr:TatD family hydrolase [Treponema sp.]